MIEEEIQLNLIRMETKLSMINMVVKLVLKNQMVDTSMINIMRNGILILMENRYSMIEWEILLNLKIRKKFITKKNITDRDKKLILINKETKHSILEWEILCKPRSQLEISNTIRT